jgi:hypothetical protein
MNELSAPILAVQARLRCCLEKSLNLTLVRAAAVRRRPYTTIDKFPPWQRDQHADLPAIAAVLVAEESIGGRSVDILPSAANEWIAQSTLRASRHTRATRLSKNSQNHAAVRFLSRAKQRQRGTGGT